MPDARWPRDWEADRDPLTGDPWVFSRSIIVARDVQSVPVYVPLVNGKPDVDGLLARLRLDPAEVERLQGALNISPDDVGRIMHESWSRTKRSQGFHHPSECPNGRCPKCHADLIPWDSLPGPQKDINRHAFDDVLAEIRRRAALAERGGDP